MMVSLLLLMILTAQFWIPSELSADSLDTPVDPEALKIQKLIKSPSTPGTTTTTDSSTNVLQTFKTVRYKKPEKSAETKFVQVMRGPARVLEQLDPGAPLLGMARQGSLYPLINHGDVWCLILYNGREGWIELGNVKIVEKKSYGFVFNEFIVIAGSIGLIIALVALIIYLLNRKKNRFDVQFSQEPTTRKKILFITNSKTYVQRYLSGGQILIETFFQELGFEIIHAHDANATQKLLYETAPDALAVDWLIGKNPQHFIEQIITMKAITSQLFVLFYNVPEPNVVSKSPVLHNVQYTGTAISDRELLNAVSPYIMRDDKKEELLRKSIESSALQGEVGAGNLPDIFHFIEVGRKTGCLVIREEKTTGIVYFNNGIIIYAASRRSIGKQAVFDILGQKRGKFLFVLGKSPQNANCSLQTLPLLMEWSKESDEASRHRLR